MSALRRVLADARASGIRVRSELVGGALAFAVVGIWLTFAAVVLS